jgi:hypothetical protein
LEVGGVGVGVGVGVVGGCLFFLVNKGVGWGYGVGRGREVGEREVGERDGGIFSWSISESEDRARAGEKFGVSSIEFFGGFLFVRGCFFLKVDRFFLQILWMSFLTLAWMSLIQASSMSEK